MILNDILAKFKKLDIFERRQITDEYIEVVFYNKQTDKWNRVLTDILGPAMKSAGVKPSKNVKRLAEKYGGVYDNQTLFRKNFDSDTVIAIFWPWQDGVHTTLKIAVEKN